MGRVIDDLAFLAIVADSSEPGCGGYVSSVPVAGATVSYGTGWVCICGGLQENEIAEDLHAHLTFLEPRE